MNKPEQPIANPPEAGHLPSDPGRPTGPGRPGVGAPTPSRLPDTEERQDARQDARVDRRTSRRDGLRVTEDEEAAAVEALIPGGAGIPYTELLEQSGMEGDDLQVILDELQAEGKIDQAVNNNVLCYYHK